VLKKKKKGCSGKDLQKKEGFKSGMKERVGDEKLIILSVAVTGLLQLRYEHDSITIRLRFGYNTLQHATRFFRALAYEIVYENQW